MAVILLSSNDKIILLWCIKRGGGGRFNHAAKTEQDEVCSDNGLLIKLVSQEQLNLANPS